MPLMKKSGLLNARTKTIFFFCQVPSAVETEYPA